MAKKQGQPFDRRTFLKTTGAVGAGTALANVASAHGEEDHSQITHGEDHSGPKPGNNQLVVGVSAGASMADVESDFPGEVEVVKRNEDLRFVVVEMPENEGEFGTLQTESRIARHSGVRYTEKNETFYPMAVSPDDAAEDVDLPAESEVNDPLFAEQYAPQQVRAPAAWNKTMGSDDVTIAIVDQGVKYDHPDLKDQFGSTKGYDFVDDDEDPMPVSPSREYHGTHVAGIASATTGNETGVAGISNSRLLSCRALGTRGGTVADIADAIKWAADEGADFVNMSLGGGGFSETMKNAVSYATNNGTLCICAAGNSCKEGVSYPAAYNECMAISAIDENLNLASFSQYGDSVDVTGPGVEVLSCWTTVPQGDPYGGKYQKISGTSMSTPAVTGVAALVKAAFPDYTPGQVRQRLKETAVDVGLSEKEQGAGRVDAVRAVGWEGESGENAGPSVEMDVEPLAPHVGQNTIFSADAGDDDGYIAEWQWEFGDGTTSTGEMAYHQFTDPGTHEVTLTVTDDDGASASTSTVIEVKRGACGDETHTESFEGQLEYGRDINRHPYTFETDDPCRIRGVMDNPRLLLFVQQQSTEFLKVECEGELVLTSDDIREIDTSSEVSIGAYSGFFSAGEYQIELTEEGFGAPQNARPEAKFTASATTVSPEEMIEFDATPSEDPDGRIDQYVWTFGDAAAASGKTAAHTFDSPGEYAVTLEVTDDRGASDSASKIITVEEPNQEPSCATSGSVTMQESAALSGQGDRQTFSHALESSDPCKATVSLSGPESADFDLYVTLDGREPTTTDYDRRSWNPGSEEEVVIGAEELAGELGVLVHAYSGSGDFKLKVSEVAGGSAGGGNGDDDSDQGEDGDNSDGGENGSGETVRKTDSITKWIGLAGEQFLRYRPQTADPEQVTLSLSGPDDEDFDMFVNLDGSRPQAYACDLKSQTPTSNEHIVVEDFDKGNELGILVQSWTGSGEFTLSIEELGK